MRLLVALSGVLLLAASVRSQVLPSATAAGSTVRAGLVTATPLPIGGDVWPGFQRQAAGTVGNAHSLVAHATTPTAITATWQLGCQAVATGSSESVASVRYTFTALQSFTGRFDIGWSPTTTGSGTATLAIDLGDDGIVDGSGAGAIPITFGPGPLVVRVTMQCNATAGSVQGPFGSSWQWSGSASVAGSLQLVAGHATTTVEGNACGTPMPSLQATPDLAGGLELRGGCPAGIDFGLLAVGFLPIVAPLPLPPTCMLLVAPELVDAQLPDAQRAVVWTFAVPLAARPLTLRSQLFGFYAATSQLTASACARTDVQ